MSSHQRQRTRRHFSRTQPQTAQTSSRSATTCRENFRQRSRVSNSSRNASSSLSSNMTRPPHSRLISCNRETKGGGPAAQNPCLPSIRLFSLPRCDCSGPFRLGVFCLGRPCVPFSAQVGPISWWSLGTIWTKRTQVRKLRSPYTGWPCSALPSGRPGEGCDRLISCSGVGTVPC